MSELGDKLHKELDALRGVRDELQVRLHLGGADIRDQWEKLEKEWQHLEGRAKVLGDESKDIAEELWDATRQVTRELREGYERLKRLL